METVELAPNEKRCSKCKEVKDRGEFYGGAVTAKDGLQSQCKTCVKFAAFQQKERNRGSKVSDGIPCPKCGLKFEFLTTHTIQKHGLNGKELKKLGVKLTVAPSLLRKMRFNYPKITRGHSHNKARKPNPSRLEYARIRKESIAFPKRYWPQDCNYVRVKVLRDKLQVSFNPLIVKRPGAKTIQGLNKKNKNFLEINVTQWFLENLNISRPIIELRKGAGFVIQFLEEDLAMFDLFDFWVKNGKCLRNISHLTTHSHCKIPHISIADHLWPTNAEYAQLKLHRSSRRGADDYIEITPVSRAGKSVVGIKQKLIDPINLKHCLKVHLIRHRLKIQAGEFLNNHFIPSGDWDLKEILPSGALRFRLYKERQPKEQSEDIAS